MKNIVLEDEEDNGWIDYEDDVEEHDEIEEDEQIFFDDEHENSVEKLVGW